MLMIFSLSAFGTEKDRSLTFYSGRVVIRRLMRPDRTETQR
jgi:hypothetical protein